MIAIYGSLGLIASIALIIYALLNLTVFKLSNLTPYGITITLAGVAGFILSIGMAVDANILIFERMREEKDQEKEEVVRLSSDFPMLGLQLEIQMFQLL